MPPTYAYPRPAVTVDTVLATVGERGELRVLLIERARPPFAGAWALPGGFVDQHEDLEVAARREMLEETHLRLGGLVQLGAYGTPHRDPRGHTVGVAFLAICGPGEAQERAGDDAADCRWFALARPPRLAFDHGVILRDARAAFWRLAADEDGFRRAFCGRRRPAWLPDLRRAVLALQPSRQRARAGATRPARQKPARKPAQKSNEPATRPAQKPAKKRRKQPAKKPTRSNRRTTQ